MSPKPKSEMCYLCVPARSHPKGEPHRRAMSATMKRSKDVAVPDRPTCDLCGLEDGACICAHLSPVPGPKDITALLAQYQAQEAVRRKRKAESQKRWRWKAKTKAVT